MCCIVIELWIAAARSLALVVSRREEKRMERMEQPYDFA